MKEKELRKKVYFTLFVLFVASTLSQIPIYGVDSSYMDSLFSKASILTFIDTLSGGSLSNMSVSGFGITSYITASIILQLLAVTFPVIERIRKDGEQGRKLFEKITFFLAIAFTIVSGLVTAIGFGKNGLFAEYSPLYVSMAVACWTVGTFIVVFLGQKVEDCGVGNGITLILGFNILSRMPLNIIGFFKTEVVGKSVMHMALYTGGLVVGLFLFYLVTVYLQTGMLKVPIKQTRKQASSQNTDGYIPINVNIANVLPVIYATTILSIPSLVIAIFDIKTGDTTNSILSVFSSYYWYKPEHWYQPFGLVVYVLLLVSFGLFSSELSFSSNEIADAMKKNGNIIPGVNPGRETVEYLEKRRKIMSMVNIVFLLVIAILPDMICTYLGISSFSFLGTSLIIVISMLFDTSLRMQAVSIHNDKKFGLFGKA